ncbi:MAG: hypothetical protein ACK59J_18160, partial [Pseudanabaena sp.]
QICFIKNYIFFKKKILCFVKKKNQRRAGGRFAPPLTSWVLCPNPKAQTYVGRTTLFKCGSPAPHSFAAIS